MLTVLYHLRRFSMGCGVLLLVLVGLTMLQLPHSQVFQRMSPNAALCFVLVGVSLCLLSVSFYQKWHLALVSFCASVVVGVGIVAASGFVGGLEAAYHWGE